MSIQTLTEGNKYDTTSLETAVIDYLVKDSEILMHMLWEPLMGNSLTWDYVATRSGAAFYEVGDTWTEGTLVLGQDTLTLKILGGDADVSNFLARTRNKIDIAQTVLADKVLAVQDKFLDTFYYGDASTVTKEFSGLHKFMTSTTYNTVHAGSSTGTALSMAKLYEAIDLQRGFVASHLAMSKTIHRGIQVYLDSIGEKYPSERDKYGVMQQWFGGKAIIRDDHILDTETATTGAYTASTGGANTTIFILTFAPQAICGVQGSNGIEIKDLGELETKDATRRRIKWYVALKFEHLRSAGKVDGIVAASAVTA